MEDRKIVVITEETVDRGEASIAMPAAAYMHTHVLPSSKIGKERDGGKEGNVFRQQFPCSYLF